MATKCFMFTLYLIPKLGYLHASRDSGKPKTHRTPMKPPSKMGRPQLNNVTVQARIPAPWLAKIQSAYPAKTAGKSLAMFIQAKLEPSPAEWLEAEFALMQSPWTPEEIERSEKAAIEQAELSAKRTAELGLPPR